MRAFSLLFLLVFAFLPATASAEKRVALVIGNSAYEQVPQLANPKNDAADMAVKLEGLGFEVVRGEDLSLAAMRDTVRQFIGKLDGADLSLFFYAGHGLQVNGSNYMAPIDAKLGSYNDLDFETLPMDLIVSAMERNTKVNLVFLDACRDNPLAENLSRSMGTRSGLIGRGLAKLGSGVGSLIAFSTQPGNVALDGEGRNSPFTTALLKYLGTPGQSVTDDLVQVRKAVLDATGGKQVPWDNSSLTGPVVLKEVPEPGGNPEQPPVQAPEASDKTDNAVELAYWEAIKDASEPKMLEAYLEQYPQGAFAKLARIKIDLLKATAERGNAKRAIAEPDEASSFDRSKLDRLDPLNALPARPNSETASPEAVELSLNLVPDDISKVQHALELFGYQVGKDKGQLSKIDRASLRKFQIRNHIAESGYLDQASLEKLIDDVASIPRDYSGKWIINFHRYQYGPEDRSGVNLRTLMATATAELRGGEFYLITSQGKTSKQSPFDTFSGKLSDDGQFQVSIRIDTLFDDESEQVQVVKATASERLPKLVAYDQPIYVRGSRLWQNRKKGEDVFLRIELIRVR